MDKQTIPTSDNPKVILVIHGDLTLKGWEEREVRAKAPSPEDLTLEQRGDEIAINCTTACTVRVPFGAQVQVQHVAGHATLKSLEGELTISEASGHLTLRSVGPTRAERVNGHLTAKNVAGELWVGVVNGNLTGRDVQGDFLVEDVVRGNLILEDVDGSASAHANGNITLSLDPAPGDSYRFAADGNLLCRLPEDTSAQVEISRVGGNLQIKLAGIETPAPIQVPYSLTLGEGDAAVELSAGGNLLISSQPPDLRVGDFEVGVEEDIENLTETISEQVAAQIETQMEILEQQLESQMERLSSMFGSTVISPERAEQIAQRARQASERAQTRAQEKMQQAQERLQRKLEAARRRAEMKSRAAERAARDRRRREPSGWVPSHPPHPPFPPPPPGEPVTEDERMLILKMLEEGKISVGEADQLLSALEGSGD